MAGPSSLLPFCDDEARRALLRDHATLQGIDFLEVVTEPPADNQRLLEVHFIPKSSAGGQQSLDDLLDFLDGRPDLVEVTGGTRIRTIEVLAVERTGDRLTVRVDPYGDFSTYTLSLERVADTNDPPRFGLDPVYGQCAFSFKVGCPQRFDCGPTAHCPPGQYPERLIDYLAKDYASFRQVLLDLLPTRLEGWNEQHAADLMVTLAELFAYTGDHLSYYQDAVANEAYLESARQRISVRRHARLIDYRMHDGASARAFVHFELDAGASGFLQAGTQVLSRILVPLGSQQPPHGTGIDGSLTAEALDAAAAVFETLSPALLDDRLNTIEVYRWGNEACCLPRGATSVDLSGDLGFDPIRDIPGGDREEYWRLKPGDFLLFEEQLSPVTGLPADANPAHRQVVRLTSVGSAQDPLTGASLTRVTWDAADALTFPLCVSATLNGVETVVSVGRGNLVLADHGRTLIEWHPANPTTDPDHPGVTPGAAPYRFRVAESPLSFRLVPPASLPTKLGAVSQLVHADPLNAVAQVQAAVRTVTETLDGWEPVVHLLDSGSFDRAFAVETDNQGRALLRFGDDEFGMAVPSGAFIQATYRVGLGPEGNVGADALVHLLPPPAAAPSGPLWVAPPAPLFPTGLELPPLELEDILHVRNPLPAWGGVAPEPIERVKQLAPPAFHAEQFRAVTEEDYARAAEKHPEVDRAVGTFRWTGSWHTVFLSIDPRGRTGVSEPLAVDIRNWVTRYTLAGYDLEIQPPIYVPLELELEVCVCREYFRSDVEAVLVDLLSNRDLPGGQRGFFHPDQFTFGQSLYLSTLYAAIEAVPGVSSVAARRFRRWTDPDPDPDRPRTRKNVDLGYLAMGRLEILRLDNDPSFPENGVLRLNLLAGR